MWYVRPAKLEYFMIVKLLTEHHLEFLSLKGDCTGSSESTLVKMSNCWKSLATDQILTNYNLRPIDRNNGPLKYFASTKKEEPIST